MPIVQLAESTDDPEIFIADKNWAIEQKFDGTRAIVEVNDGQVRAFNRQGALRTHWPTAVTKTLSSLPGKWVFDGELLGSTFHTFDLLELPGQGSIADQPWEARRMMLDKLFASANNLPANLSTTIWNADPIQKQAFYDRCVAEAVEGVMFKRLDAPYRGQRTPNWLKHKFQKSCEAVVMELNRKGKDEAITLGLFANGNLVEVAGCRLLPKFKQKVAVGTVVEVRYLYATADHRLYQPCMLAVRTDKPAIDCTIDQLIYTSKNVLTLDLPTSRLTTVKGTP